MVQVVQSSGDIFGRIGKGVGQGLSEQLPKEVERHRLSSGLKQFEKDSANLNPIQQLARISTIPGITPQMIQSFGELAKHQAQANALQKSPFPESKSQQQTTPNASAEAPSITTRSPIEATLNHYIPKTLTEIQSRAGQLYNENPGLYKNDPALAITAAETEDQQNQAINAAYQQKRKNEQDVQNKVSSGLKDQSDLLNVKVPSTVFSKIEDKAINSVKSKSEGGEGLTEQEAKKKYGKELDSISRDYESINTVGNYRLLFSNPKGNKDTLRSIRNKFKSRDDLENFADTMIAKNGLSPSKAYYLAYPVSEQKELNNAIVKIPKLKSNVSHKLGSPGLETLTPVVRNKTLEVSEKIAPLLGEDASPLSVAEELRAKGYDPEVWMEYVDKNRDKLNITERQGRELDKPRSFWRSLNDIWMFTLSGLDELEEQE